MTVEQIGKINNLHSFIDWCCSKRELIQPDSYYSGYRRQILPIGYVGQIENGSVTYDLASKDIRFDKFATHYLPNWKLALLLNYQPGGAIRLHRDSTPYGPIACSLSSTDFELIHDGKIYQCFAGCVYKFPTKKLHGVLNIPQQRWAIIWWEPNWRYWTDQQL